jgi:hypothetical protein
MKLLKQTTPLEKFLPHVLAFTLGNEQTGSLPDNAALSFIRNSAFTFAEKTGILKDTLTIDLQCGLDSYPLEMVSCEQIISVSRAKLGDFESVDCGFGWTWGNVDFQFYDDVLKVWPVPTENIEHGLEVDVILAPNKDACEVDSRLYDKWHEAIIHGALAEIHMMPGRPWSSVSRADYRRRLFNEEISRAIGRKVLNGKGEMPRMSMNNDWNVGSHCRRGRW